MGRRRSSQPRRRPSSTRNRANWGLVLGGVLVLLLVGVVLTRTSGKGAGPLATPASAGSNVPYPEVPRISVADARALYDSGAALFVDVRGEEPYRQAHIPGSISLPFLDLEERYSELPQDAQIITICT